MKDETTLKVKIPGISSNTLDTLVKKDASIRCVNLWLTYAGIKGAQFYVGRFQKFHKINRTLLVKILNKYSEDILSRNDFVLI